MIDEIAEAPRALGGTPPAKPGTRAEQREATRRAVVEAAAACLVGDGYAALTTRRVAERAGIAQSTVMHHFPTRHELLVEAVTEVALGLAEHALEEIDLAALRAPEHREAVIDQAWRALTSPQALAAAELWAVAWIEPELAITLRDLEQRITAILLGTARTLFPGQADDPRFPALIDSAFSLLRGLIFAIPVSGREAVEQRWQQIKPLLLESAAELLDDQ